MNSEKTNLSDLAASGTAVSLATVFGRGLTFIAEIILIRTLVPSTYGSFALAFAIVYSFGRILLLGIDEGVTRQVSYLETWDEKYKIILSGFITAVVSGIVGASILNYYRYDIAMLTGDQELSSILVLFLPYLLLLPLAKVSYGVLRSEKQSLHAILSRDLGGKGLSFITLFIVILLGYDYFAPPAYWVSFPLFMFLLSILFISRNIKLPSPFIFIPSRDTFIDLWKFSWPLAIGSGVFLLLSKMDILMVGYFLESKQVGYYRSVAPLQQVATFALGSFTFIFLPIATEYYNNGNMNSLGTIFKVSTKWMLLISLPPTLVLATYSPSVVRVLFGSSYQPASPVLSVLVFGLLCRTLSGLNSDIVKATGQTKIEMFSSFGGLLINFLLNILLIPAFGISGAAVATVFGYAVYNGVELIWIRRLHGITPFSIKIVKLLAGILFANMGIYLVVPDVLNLFELVFIGILLISLQPIVLVLTNSVDSADIEVIEQIESKYEMDLDTIKAFLSHGITNN